LGSLKRVFAFCALLLFSSSLYFEAVVSASGHMVINEFEQNPPGNDNYLSVEEWVELYNPASENVNIGGWTLSTTSGETDTVSIPDGTVIDANGYYVFSRGSPWLDNDAEAIVLRDTDGNEVDRTPARSDDENDGWSWARYPDGQDTDLDTDWRFQTSTKGASNGARAPTPPSTPLTENVTVYFIDVGQGDSIFVDTPDQDMLIDAGIKSAGETVVDYLQALGVTRIDVIVATHPDQDHIGGLITVLTEYNITQAPRVIDSGYEKTTNTYRDYIELAELRTVEYLTRWDSFLLDDGVNVTVLNPTSPLEFRDSNENSVVLRMKVSGVTFLFTGDAEVHTEESILESGLEVSANIMKLGHHGSRTSTNATYLDAVNPEVAVICVGEGNQYSHPHEETLDKLFAEGSTVYRTDLHGTVEITTDGVDYSVKTEKLSLTPPPPPIISNLSITPPEIERGENVTIGLDIENIDSQSFTYIVTMKIENVNDPPPTWPPYNVSLTIYVELGAYESKAVSHTITLDTIGDYNVTVDGLTGSFTVKAPPKPAEFEFSNLRIFYPGVIPPEVERGQTVTVTVSIEAENVGELEGSRTVELKVDGEVTDSKGVTLEGGASATVLFELTRGEGTHEVEVEGFTESFTVNPKPSFWDRIPGFPYESIILGLLTGVFVLWLLSRRKMTL
jgi:beta-lactamase superfamily II metal-dependent hydrolase